ncbi:MAG: hypothetical protein OHK0048_01980 [Rhodoferax sp.]
MLAIKKARKLILAQPESTLARTLADLVLALQREGTVSVRALYELDYPSFELAMDILREWRIDRYYATKLQLFDLSEQIHAGTCSAADSEDKASS